MRSEENIQKNGELRRSILVESLQFFIKRIRLCIHTLVSAGSLTLLGLRVLALRPTIASLVNDQRFLVVVLLLWKKLNNIRDKEEIY